MVLAPSNEICFWPLVTECPVMGGGEAGVTDNRQMLNYLKPPQLEDILSDQK